MSKWLFAYLMPHTGFLQPIEHYPLALVPPNDPRLIENEATSKAVSQLTSNFSDQFGKKVRPAALLVYADALKSMNFYKVLCFRNAVAVASIIDAATMQYSGGRVGYPQWADYFDLYAFTVTPDNVDLVTQSLLKMELNKPDKFSGQRAPHLVTSERLSFGFDKRIFEGCMRFWDRRFISNRNEWKTRVLFRSLEIATQASRVPAVGTKNPTIHDLGVGIALWVSAFEILSHPRTGQANLGTVLNLLDLDGWLDPKLESKRFKVQYPRGTTLNINWIQRFYYELYRARNDFLHGNPVAAGRLFPTKRAGGPTLLHIAPLIYKAALVNVLPGEKSKAKKGDLAHLTEFLSSQSDQSKYEEAVLHCRPGKKKT